MPLDGITSKFLSKELSASLSDGRVDKIYQKNKYEILFSIRNPGKTNNLVISCNPSFPRIYITSETSQNPPSPPRFCTILRKHILNSKILSVHSPDYERIFLIKFQSLTSAGDLCEKTLISEIMGRHSNIILVDEDYNIIDCAIRIDKKTSSVRQVLPGISYLQPPKQNKKNIEDILSEIEKDIFFPDSFTGTIKNFLLSRIKGISARFADEICYSADIDSATQYTNIEKKRFYGISNVLKTYIEMILREKHSPCVFYLSANMSNPMDFHALRFASYVHYKETQTVSEAMDIFYSYNLRKNDFIQKKSFLIKKVNKILSAHVKKTQRRESELKQSEDAVRYKKCGDLIFANIHKIKKGDSYLIAEDIFEQENGCVKVPLNKNYSPSKNAQIYYDKYKKLQSRKNFLTHVLKKDANVQSYLQSIVISLENSETNDDLDSISKELEKSKIIRKKKPSKISSDNKEQKPLGPRKFITEDGFEILAGRNNLQNDMLAMRKAKDSDYWFHLQKAPGTHVILRTNGKDPSDAAIVSAAKIAAWYSKSDSSGITKAKLNIDYCLAKHVRKPKGSPPGHVIYDNFKTILVEAQFPENIKI